MTYDIPLPRLLDASGATERRITPVTVSIDFSITPLSYATMALPINESLPARAYVELFTVLGSAGIFRVSSPQDSFGQDTAAAQLEHAVVEVGDYLVRAKYDEMMSASTAMTTVFSHYRGTKWQLGDIFALGSDPIALQADHNKVLEAMLSILDQKPDCMMDFDFTTTPWTINIVPKGVTVTAEGRLSRNVNAAEVTYDDTELCTVAYYEVDGEWYTLEADTKDQYGVVERDAKVSSSYTAEEALYAATQYLEAHKHPRVSIEITGEELSEVTGEELDSFGIGELFRLVLVDYNQLPVEKTITGLRFPNVYESPTDIMVFLEQEKDTLVTFLHDVDSKGGSVGGGGGRKIMEGEIRSIIDKTPEMIHMEVGYAVSGFAQSVIEQTTTYIRTEVSNAASAISHSVIEQTTEYVRTEVSNVASGVAWSVVEQTMTGIIQEVGRKSKIYVQWTDPNNGINVLREGDIWIKRQTNRTWNEANAAGEKWNQSGVPWRSKYGDLQYVWKNGKWNPIGDTAADVENEVRIEQNSTDISIIGHAIDTNRQEYNSKLQVTAREIRGEVNTANSQVYSVIRQTSTNIYAHVENEIEGVQTSIEQTADSINASVSAAKSALYSTIAQTATNIRLAVKNDTDGLQTQIEQTADSINTSVSAAKSTLYSAISQTATQIRSEVVGKNGVISAINQTAESILIQAGKINLDGYVTTSMLQSAFASAGQIACSQLSISDYFQFGAYGVSWKSFTHHNFTVGSSHNFVYKTNGVEYTTSGYIMGTHSTTTIYYLGR